MPFHFHFQSHIFGSWWWWWGSGCARTLRIPPPNCAPIPYRHRHFLSSSLSSASTSSRQSSPVSFDVVITFLIPGFIVPYFSFLLPSALSVVSVSSLPLHHHWASFMFFWCSLALLELKILRPPREKALGFFFIS